MRDRVLMSVLIVSIGLLALPAGAVRCRGHVVGLGDHQIEVRDRCGEPLSTSTQVVYPYQLDAPHQLEARGEAGAAPRVRLLDFPMQVDEWVYDLGGRRFRQLLRFHNGRLIDIQSLDKAR